MGFLYELEETYEGKIRQALKENLEERMLKARPSCPECGGLMHLHDSYPRGIVTKYGLIELKVPLFQCPSDLRTKSGIEALGAEEVRQRFSKKNEGRSPKASRVGFELQSGGYAFRVCEEQPLQVAEEG